MNIKLILKFLINPDKNWNKILHKYTGWKAYIHVAAIFALIGPALSFYSLTLQLNYSYKRAFIYSATTYLLDMGVVLIFAIFLSKILNINFDRGLVFAVFINLPIWISDIVDIYQPLRVLSNLGLLYSLFLLYTGLKSLDKYSLKIYILLGAVHIFLYMADAFIAEMIATNPVLKKLLFYIL